MSLKVEILDAGSCKHPEFMMRRNGRLRVCTFPATVVYIKHPKAGHILFDTGYLDTRFRS